jgi:hypothetical protein
MDVMRDLAGRLRRPGRDGLGVSRNLHSGNCERSLGRTPAKAQTIAEETGTCCRQGRRPRGAQQRRHVRVRGCGRAGASTRSDPLRPNTIDDCSTVSADTARSAAPGCVSVARNFSTRPSAAEPKARNGTLAIMVGGDAQAFERAGC